MSLYDKSIRGGIEVNGPVIGWRVDPIFQREIMRRERVEVVNFTRRGGQFVTPKAMCRRHGSPRAPLRPPRSVPGHPAPVVGCTCGWRVVTSREELLRYQIAQKYVGVMAPIWTAGPVRLAGVVMTRVETMGRVVAGGDEDLPSLGCLRAEQLRVAWPAFVADESLVAPLRARYGQRNIFAVRDWEDVTSIDVVDAARARELQRRRTSS